MLLIFTSFATSQASGASAIDAAMVAPTKRRGRIKKEMVKRMSTKGMWASLSRLTDAYSPSSSPFIPRSAPSSTPVASQFCTLSAASRHPVTYHTLSSMSALYPPCIGAESSSQCDAPDDFHMHFFSVAIACERPSYLSQARRICSHRA